jgi:hypothetical protein
LGTQALRQTSVLGYLSSKVITTRTRNILQNYLQGLSKNCIRSTRASKGYRRSPRTRATIATRSPGTGRRLGNNSLRIWKKDIEKNNIPTVHGKYNCPYVTGYSPYTGRYSPNKHTIQVGKIGSLLLPIGKQDHKTRSLGSSGTY